MHAQSLHSCLTLGNPMDRSPSGSSVHGISQARILEWVAISFSMGSSWPRDWTHISCIAGKFFATEPPGKLLHTWLSDSVTWWLLELFSQKKMIRGWKPYPSSHSQLEGSLKTSVSNPNSYTQEWHCEKIHPHMIPMFSRKLDRVGGGHLFWVLQTCKTLLLFRYNCQNLIKYIIEIRYLGLPWWLRG